jgi:hypothetical protein
MSSIFPRFGAVSKWITLFAGMRLLSLETHGPPGRTVPQVSKQVMLVIVDSRPMITESRRYAEALELVPLLQDKVRDAGYLVVASTAERASVTCPRVVSCEEVDLIRNYATPNYEVHLNVAGATGSNQRDFFRCRVEEDDWIGCHRIVISRMLRIL